MKLDRDRLRSLVKAALEEDIGSGDLTSLGCLEPNPIKARIVAKSDGILSGVIPATMVFEVVDSANRIDFLIDDGQQFRVGDIVAEIDGFNLTLLTSERVALNFLARLSGIATLTNKFAGVVKKVAVDSCHILDTRKTTPGMRQLEKMAVVHGGGMNHRQGLYDMILIKDNHIASAGSISAAVKSAREYLGSSDFRLQFEIDASDVEIEVEVVNEEQLAEANDCGIIRLLLDNQTPDSLSKLVAKARILNPNIKLEASGNVSLENVAEIASSGVDYISIGALTHSAPVSDFSLLVYQ